MGRKHTYEKTININKFVKSNQRISKSFMTQYIKNTATKMVRDNVSQDELDTFLKTSKSVMNAYNKGGKTFSKYMKSKVNSLLQQGGGVRLDSQGNYSLKFNQQQWSSLSKYSKYNNFNKKTLNKLKQLGVNKNLINALKNPSKTPKSLNLMHELRNKNIDIYDIIRGMGPTLEEAYQRYPDAIRRLINDHLGVDIDIDIINKK